MGCAGGNSWPGFSSTSINGCSLLCSLASLPLSSCMSTTWMLSLLSWSSPYARRWVHDMTICTVKQLVVLTLVRCLLLMLEYRTIFAYGQTASVRTNAQPGGGHHSCCVCVHVCVGSGDAPVVMSVVEGLQSIALLCLGSSTLCAVLHGRGCERSGYPHRVTMHCCVPERGK